MPITLHVSLLSGRTVPIETQLDVDVRAFKRRAQRALSVGEGRLVHSNGSVLDEAMTIQDSELVNGDFLSLQMQPIQMQAARAFKHGAFAGVLGDGSVLAWGRADYGGDSSAVQDQLRNLQHVQASESAFAAILADGDLGQCSLRWRQQCCARSAAKSAAYTRL